MQKLIIPSVFVGFFAGILAPEALALRSPATTELAVSTAKLATLRPIAEVTEKNTLGINLEDTPIREQMLEWAKEYSKVRALGTRGRMPYLKKCEETPDNPYCRFEIGRFNAPPPPRKKRVRISGDVIESIRKGKFDAVAKFNGAEAYVAVKRLTGKTTDIAKRALIQEECVNPDLLLAIGNKLEESFPKPEVVRLTTAVYEKAGTCGDEAASGTATFRLGLIKVWSEDCAAIDGIMSRVEQSKAVPHFHSRAKFWRHHCARVLGKTDDLARIKDDLIRKHPLSFHALIINQDEPTLWKYIEQTQTPQIAMRSLAKPSINSRVRAIEALILLKNTSIASEMANFMAEELELVEPEVRLYLAVLMDRADQTLQNFKILNDIFQNAPKMVSRATMKLFFPLKFWNHIESKNRVIDPMLLLSLIRQESAFNLNARSPAGARGLMQVMPSTARYIASVRTSNKLFDPQTNIDVGTTYFVKRLNQLNGDVELTLAAYNAGYSRIGEWKRRYPTENRLLFLDLIPFRETREYVTSILRNYYWYMHLYKDEFENQSAYRNLWQKQMPFDPSAMFGQNTKVLIRPGLFRAPKSTKR